MEQADPIIAEVTRNGFVESVHHGRVVALDGDGNHVLAVGDVSSPILLRSCAKPFQAAAMLRCGLDLDGPHLAVAAASHDGTPAHLALVSEVLAGAGLDASALDNTPALALEPTAAAAQLLSGAADRLHQNCSGKHAAMLATCVGNGWPIVGYLDRSHPLQQAILATTEDLCGAPIAHLAVDGCGAPIGAVALDGLARGFARLATAGADTAEGRVAAAIRAHPDVMGGGRRDVTRLLRACPDLIAKDGAEGCFAAASRDGRAVAVKVSDGSSRAAAPVVVAALRAVGVDGPQLDGLAEPAILGHGRPVGELRPMLRHPR